MTRHTPSGREHSMTLLGSKLHYWAYGPLRGAPVIVAVHGFRGTHHGLERIVGAAPGYTWIVPDLPGFGASTPMAGPAHDVGGYAHLVREFVKAVTRPGEDVVLLGHSFGSIVAASVATDPPANVSRLVLVNPIARKPRLLGRLGTRLYFAVGGLLNEEHARRFFSDSRTVDAMSLKLTKTRDKPTRAYVRGQHRAYFSDYANKQTLRDAFKASVGRTVGEFAAKITVPTLLIAGSRDEIAPIGDQYKLLDKMRSPTELAVIENVGHLTHYETPADVATYIRAFLDS